MLSLHLHNAMLILRHVTPYLRYCFTVGPIDYSVHCFAPKLGDAQKSVNLRKSLNPHTMPNTVTRLVKSVVAVVSPSLRGCSCSPAFSSPTPLRLRAAFLLVEHVPCRVATLRRCSCSYFCQLVNTSSSLRRRPSLVLQYRSSNPIFLGWAVQKPSTCKL